MSDTTRGLPFAGGFVVKDGPDGQISWLEARAYARAQAASLDLRQQVSEALGQVFRGSAAPDAARLAMSILDGSACPSLGQSDLDAVEPVGDLHLAPSAAPHRSDLTELHCALGPRAISLHIGDDRQAGWVEALFAPALLTSPGDEALHIRLWPNEDQWLVAVDDLAADVFETRVAAHWHLVRTAWQLSHPDRRWLALLHAAAVRTSTSTIILAGTSGAGKTSLAASLLAHGARQLADDLVAIDAVRRDVWPVPLSTSVKPGSWQAIHGAWETLAEGEAVILPGTDTRFVRLKPAYRANAPSPLPMAVIFPVYEAGAETVVVRLTPLELLAGLGHTGTIFPDEDETLEAFLHWADHTPAYVLNYGDADQAVAAAIDTVDRLGAMPSSTTGIIAEGDLTHG